MSTANESTPTSISLKRKLSSTSSSPAPGAAPNKQEQSAKRRKSSRTNVSATDTHNDCYCWICHKEGEVICCETCPRVFHIKCIQLEKAPTEDWVCPECVLIMTAENMDTRSRAMRLLTVDQLCVLLKHALGRMRTVSGVEPFVKPVDHNEFPSYRDYITCPMDLSTIEKNIKKKQYGSTEAFLADTKWILHNCIIFNSTGSKLTSIAKSLVKVCKHEMQEIENCPDCYLNAHTKKESWFVAACRIPHLLVWAKLKGFPFWPGKAMRVNSEENVDVRFFGAHDRAWIPIKDVFLYSHEAPVVMRNKKKGNLDGCVHEVELYIKNITEKFGAFEHAPSKINYDPKKEEEQIKILYPKCALPFDLGSTRHRTRTFSYSGSERSVTATPTPSEMDVKDEDDFDEGDLKGLKDDDEVPPMMTENMVGKEIIDDEVMGTSEEEASKEPAPEPVKAEKEKSSKTTQPDKKSKKTESKMRTRASSSETKIHDTNRASESPPCEVSSTTATDPEKSSKRVTKQAEHTQVEENTDKVENDKNSKNSGPESEPAEGREKEVRTAIIAETSEAVEIEGPQEDDEDEIDDVEEIEEIDDVEPEEETAVPEEAVEVEAQPEEPEEPEEENPPEEMETQEDEPVKVSEPEQAADESQDGTKDLTEEEVSKTTDDQSAPEKVPDKKSTPPTEEEEIDDVEPDAEDDVEEIVDEDEEETVDPPQEDLDTSRLLASGVSVTIVEKSKQKPVEEKSSKESPKESPKESSTPAAASKVVTDIGLGSDISVTLVQKKKSTSAEPSMSTESTESTSTTPAAQKVPKISVKKESELLQDPGAAKDVVQVHNIIGGAAKAKKPFPSKSSETSEASTPSSAASKNPPEPIVTISKVQPNSAPEGTSLLKSSVASSKPPTSSSAAPVVSSPHSVPISSPQTRFSPASSIGSLASILGAPRMSGPGYRPGGVLPQPPMHGLRPGSSSSPGLRSRMPMMGPSPMGPNMPSLHPRPPAGPLSFPPLQVPPVAGPVSEQLNRVSSKLVDFMRGSLEELFRELSAQGSPEATIKSLQLEMEKLQWKHQQELAEVKHNMDLVIMDVRQSMEAEKQKVISDLKKQFDLEKQKAIAETKKKQWCANCGKEAIFYCCWNTSYCDYPCQQAHWPSHMSTCAQNQSSQDEETATPEAMDVMETAAGHFLGQATSRSSGNGMMDQARGLQAGHLGMPFGPQHGLSPRMMNQLGMRFASAQQRFPAQMRFPGSYFM